MEQIGGPVFDLVVDTVATRITRRHRWTLILLGWAVVATGAALWLHWQNLTSVNLWMWLQ